MNTPRQPNVRTPIENFPDEIRSSGHYERTSTLFVTALKPGPKANASIVPTGTSRPLPTDDRPLVVPAK